MAAWCLKSVKCPPKNVAEAKGRRPASVPALYSPPTMLRPQQGARYTRGNIIYEFMWYSGYRMKALWFFDALCTTQLETKTKLLSEIRNSPMLLITHATLNECKSVELPERNKEIITWKSSDPPLPEAPAPALPRAVRPSAPPSHWPWGTWEASTLQPPRRHPRSFPWLQWPPLPCRSASRQPTSALSWEVLQGALSLTILFNLSMSKSCKWSRKHTGFSKRHWTLERLGKFLHWIHGQQRRSHLFRLSPWLMTQEAAPKASTHLSDPARGWQPSFELVKLESARLPCRAACRLWRSAAPGRSTCASGV